MHGNMIKLGFIIRNAREAKGYTQAELAEKIDVSIRTIIAIEKSQRNPTYDVLYRLVRTLDISANLIFYPEHTSLTPEQDQVIREFLACDEQEQLVITATLRSLMRALHKCRAAIT